MTDAATFGVEPIRVAAAGRLFEVAGELAKLAAFVRRDFLVAWSYRLAFFTDLSGLVITVATFYFVGKMVDPSKLPEFGGTRITYMEFVLIGILLASFLQIGLGSVRMAMRNEQLAGTLESLLMTPTARATIQVGSVTYDLLYVPIRTLALIALTAVAFGLDVHLSGLAPAAVALVAFIPFVWGLGVASAGAVLTLKRSSGGIVFGTTLVTMTSGAFFPLALLPSWAASVAAYNPMAVTIDAMRDALLGGVGWSAVDTSVLLLVPLSLASLATGVLVFRLALRRERGTGTLGLY